MEPILSARNIVKKFGGLTAVNKVSLDVYPGEVIGLVGDNAAGKSTLIKCISGVYVKDEGEIIYQGKHVEFSKPIEARSAGIETIYQDLALAGNLNVSANIFMGREIKKPFLGNLLRTLDEDKMLAEAKQVLNELEIHIPDYRQKIDVLSGGQRQAVAIARAMYWDAKLMIMDEPTNNLGVIEQRKVLALIHKLREQRVPVILISHTLPDVFAVTDRIVVMHRGRKVAEKKTPETDSAEIVQYMVGALDDTRTAEVVG
ncbi:MAG: sugar ABC transporter ATP-binding protein [Anaerolineae bacterium]|nr:sugar ABC transporter ATP-binding protein [Anaerolineae bacterium]